MSFDFGTMHLVALAVPYPANYGGSIDIFYKIKALHALGVEIHLHSFAYGERQPQAILNDFCKTVDYYPRHKWNLLKYWQQPYIVSSRADKNLLHRIAAAPAPVLLEGLHCAAFLNYKAWAACPQWLRMHNIEWQYYEALAQQESAFLKRLYYRWESKRLKTFESQLRHAKGILAISPSEYEYLKARFPQTHYLPVFHGNTALSNAIGRGDYLLYQGNLSVNENQRAAYWILEHLAGQLPYEIVIAGQHPPDKLQKDIANFSNVRLVANPDDATMQALTQNAHVQLLPTFQSTGIKLKLLNALFQGRFCLANTPMVANTGLESLCLVADNPEDWRQQIQELMQCDFSAANIEKREAILLQDFDNHKNAKKLMELMGS